MASFTTLTHLLFPYLSILHKATYSNLIPTRSCQKTGLFSGLNGSQNEENLICCQFMQTKCLGVSCLVQDMRRSKSSLRISFSAIILFVAEFVPHDLCFIKTRIKTSYYTARILLLHLLITCPNTRDKHIQPFKTYE